MHFCLWCLKDTGFILLKLSRWDLRTPETHSRIHNHFNILFGVWAQHKALCPELQGASWHNVLLSFIFECFLWLCSGLCTKWLQGNIMDGELDVTVSCHMSCCVWKVDLDSGLIREESWRFGEDPPPQRLNYWKRECFPIDAVTTYHVYLKEVLHVFLI